MPFSVLLLALAAQSSQLTVVARRWAPFISPMGEPFRSRGPDDDTMAQWFRQADRDRDGTITPAEMRLDAERFFALLDSKADGAVLPEEIIAYEWTRVPEVQVNSPWRRARGEPAPSAAATHKPSGGYDAHGLEGGARYALLNLPQPVAAADTDFDRAVTLDEFRAAAEQRFRLLDRTGDRRLSWADVDSLRPPLASEARRAKRRDKRVAVPVPLGD